MNRRFDDLIRLMDAQFQGRDEKLYRVEQVIDGRLKLRDQPEPRSSP